MQIITSGQYTLRIETVGVREVAAEIEDGDGDITRRRDPGMRTTTRQQALD